MVLPNPLQHLRDLDRTSPHFHKQLSEFLRRNEYQTVVPTLQGEDLEWVIEYLDSVLVDISDPASTVFQESLHEVKKICGVREVLPKSCTISDSLLDISLSSASGYVSQGILDGSKVRIKRVRMYPKGALRETFYQVAVVWKHLTHPNIVPLLGVTTGPLQFISGWIHNGDLTEYITNHPDTNRICLLSDVADGLSYLHSCNAIHGSLKGSNILVDTTGRARITDLGLAIISQDLDSIRSASAEHGRSERWIAPEILDNQGQYSKEGDIFSFAMVVIEVFIDTDPFIDKPPYMGILAIAGGERPPRPTNAMLTDALWVLTQRCWAQEANQRPQVSEVSEMLQISCGIRLPAWKRLIGCPLTADERISLITEIFSDNSEIRAVSSLCGKDAQSFVDVIDEMLDNLVPSLRRKCLKTLCKICGHRALLPRSVQVPPCHDRMTTPLCHGGYADVWKGEHQGREVAVKVLKVYLTSDFDEITRRFCKEVVTWKTLRHENVLPLLGVTMGDNQFSMVSEWMANGNINQFIKVHKDANRFELLKGIVQGLMYMHSQGMIHGDLKGANILIDQHGHARLTDFGLLTIASDCANPSSSSSSTNSGTARWMGPELLHPDHFGLKSSRRTVKSDCYALGMVIYEVLAGQAPLAQYNKYIVPGKIIDGERPGRPQGAEGVWFADDLWGTLEECWLPHPRDRPNVEAVLECLQRASTAREPLPPGADNDIQTNDEDESCSTVSYPSGQITAQNWDEPPVSSQSHLRCLEDPAMGGSEANQTHLATLVPGSTTRVIASLRGKMARTGWNTNQLLNIVNRPLGPERTLGALIAFTSSKNYMEVVRMLNREDAAKLVDVFDQTIGSIDPGRTQNMTLLRALGSICSATAQLPHTTILSDGLERCGDIAAVSGGLTDTWRGRYRMKNVALKAFRHYPIQDLKEAEKILWKEVVIWKRLSHDYVLPFYGVDRANFQLALVYDWADSGNIIQYLNSNPNVSRTRLLREVAEGLQYLHSHGIIHGDLKGANVLISSSGHARLSDYGLMPIQSNHAFMVAATPGVVGISRWLAPEIIDPPRRKSYRQPAGTEQADIFAFAMLVIEVFTGELPFGDVKHETAILMIAQGQRPERPHDAESRGLTTGIWRSTQKCWHQNPSKRPSVSAVVNAWQCFDSQESLRGSTWATGAIYQEKRQSQFRRPIAESTGRRKKMWFCGLF